MVTVRANHGAPDSGRLGFGGKDLDEITPPSVRTWRAERLKATGATTVAKSYRLRKAILQTAVDDDLLRTNPCRIKGAGKEEADERPTATVRQVFEHRAPPHAPLREGK
ncbi:hypothetical protein GCM10010339_67500 [Streptomyces alanosinicus]|uniref:Integrase SAM-like N-terminal domain-containing protein n=1 Tax=Streptomyces alanosinicus TaxID=68171 RepID=A0A919D6F7_9ACTN|nr:hypothetical protein GCM10010339_67500 [Streptomyces alanosinicus]